MSNELVMRDPNAIQDRLNTLRLGCVVFKDKDAEEDDGVMRITSGSLTTFVDEVVMCDTTEVTYVTGLLEGKVVLKATLAN